MRIHALIAAAALLASASAQAAPYATTYHGTIASSQIPADAPDGAAFTLTLVFDNGGSSATSQHWNIGDLACGFWRWRVDGTRSVAVALDLGGGVAQGLGSARTDAAGALTQVFSSVNTGGPMAWADYGVSGLAPGTAIGWFADGTPQVFGLMAGGGGGSFDDGAGTAAGGVDMAPARWSAPLPFTGACDASAEPPVAHAIGTHVTPAEGGTLTCPATALHGSSAHCTAQPAPGYTTETIDGCGGTATGAGVNGYDTGAITGACTVAARFTRNAYAIATSATPTNGGTLDCPATVAHGGDAVCHAAAATGFGFSHFTGCDSASGSTCTLANVQGPRSVAAVFTPIAPAGVAIPVLAPWGVWLLAGLLGVLGLRRRGG